MRLPNRHAYTNDTIDALGVIPQKLDAVVGPVVGASQYNSLFAAEADKTLHLRIHRKSSK